MRLLYIVALMLSLPSAVVGQDFETIDDKFPSQLLVERLDPKYLGAAPPTKQPRFLVETARALIQDFEGWALSRDREKQWAIAYNDTAGYCTIGYGHLIAHATCQSLKQANKLGEFASAISKDRGNEIFDQDSVAARQAVETLLPGITLSHEQFGALSSFVFNVGAGNFETSTMRRFLKQNNFASAAKEFRRWVLDYGNKEQPGLVTRRSCEASLFLGTLKLDEKGAFDRARCTSLGAAPPNVSLVNIRKGEDQ